MYNVLDVSRFVINYCNGKKYLISNLRLQKLLYFIQAYFLKNGEEPCFSENIEAWNFGPVVPCVYYEYKKYGNSNIPEVQNFMTVVQQDGKIRIVKMKFNDSVIDEKDRVVIQSIIDSLSRYSTTDLVNVTHNQSPWKDAYVPNKRRRIITNEAIRSFFING